MADPLTIFGSVASVLSIIDVLTRVSQGLIDLRSQWKGADVALLSLHSQIRSLRAALVKINQWMKRDVEEVHHQLIMDLEASLQCCQVLADTVDSEVAQLLKKPDGTLLRASKARFWLKSNGLAEVQTMIERQTSALTLLLTACNSITLSEQQQILSNSNSRKAMESIRKDSASLIVHSDRSSLLTSYTDNLSKLSVRFDFDGELFSSKVYESVFRGPVKRSLRFRRAHSIETSDQTNIEILKRVEVSVSRDNRPRISEPRYIETSKRRNLYIFKQGEMSDITEEPQDARQKNILILGVKDSSKSTLWKQIKHLHDDAFLDSERAEWRNAIYDNLEPCIERISREIERDLTFKSPLLPSEALDMLPPSTLVTTYKRLRDVEENQHISQQQASYLTQDSIEYFLQNYERISRPDYLPTNKDIFNARVPTSGIHKLEVNINGHGCSVCDVGGSRGQRKNWVCAFENIDVVIFPVPMDSYYQPNAEECGKDSIGTMMDEALAVWESICYGEQFIKAAMMLCFTKMDIFEKMIVSSRHPLGNFFTDYQGDQTDFVIARDFITRKFEEAAKERIDEMGNLSIHYLNATRTEDVQNLLSELGNVLSR